MQRCHAAKLQFVLLRRCNLQCRGVASYNTTALQLAVSRCCKLQRYGVATCSVAVLQAITLRRCNLQCRGAASYNAAALQLSTTLQRIALRCCTCCYSATRVAAALWRYTGCCDVAAARGVISYGAAAGRRATSCGVAATRVLRLCGAAAAGVLRLCDAATARGVETLRHWRCSSSAASRHCSNYGCCFFFLMILGKFSCTCKKEKNREQEKTRENKRKL